MCYNDFETIGTTDSGSFVIVVAMKLKYIRPFVLGMGLISSLALVFCLENVCLRPHKSVVRKIAQSKLELQRLGRYVLDYKSRFGEYPKSINDLMDSVQTNALETAKRQLSETYVRQFDLLWREEEIMIYKMMGKSDRRGDALACSVSTAANKVLPVQWVKLADLTGGDK